MIAFTSCSPNPALQNYQTAEGEFVKYKGRSYCWISISGTGVIQLNGKMGDFLNLEIGMVLLSIQSSDIAFTMRAKGPLLEKAKNYDDIKQPRKCPFYQHFQGSVHYSNSTPNAFHHIVAAVLRCFLCNSFECMFFLQCPHFFVVPF